MFVKVHEDESIESALNRFKKKVDNEKIIKIYREKEFYIKPSEKRRMKKKEAIRKYNLKKNRKKLRNKPRNVR